MSLYKSKPCSREELRAEALAVRSALGLEKRLRFPLMWFLECLHILCPRFSFEVVEDDQLPKNEYAHTDVVNHVIRIKESVYDGAYVGNGRDRMTIAHEIGHYVLMCVRGFGLQRNLSKTPARTYEDPEWQAMCFAAELLVPAHLVRGMGASEIARKCGVSREAAEYQLRKLGR